MRNKYVIAGKIILPACVFIFLSVMGICSLFEKEYRLEIENRMSNLYPEWQDSLWIEGEYQRKVNDAVADQLPLAMDAKKNFYSRGLSEWRNEKGWLTDTCLDGQDTFMRLLDMLEIPYDRDQ